MMQPAPPAAHPPRFPTWFAPSAAGAALLALTALFAPSPVWLDLSAILVLGWFLPGLLLALQWRLPDVNWPALILHALGLGLCWLIAGALLIHYLPGEIPRTLLLAVYGFGALALAVWTWLRPPPMPAHGAARTWQWGLLLLLFAALLRLPGLGYHEFHADEVVLLRQAARAVEGQDDALAEHTKGPGEIALALAVYRALNTADETTHRLPFALMSVGSVLALAWLGSRMFGGSIGAHAGVWAGLLLAANGFALGLSRIAQYQPAVLLYSVLAVLAMWEFARACHSVHEVAAQRQRSEESTHPGRVDSGLRRNDKAKRHSGLVPESSGPGRVDSGLRRNDSVRYLTLAAAYCAFGLVLHYEFALLAPALLYLAWLGFRRTPDRRFLWTAALVSAAVAAAIVAAAYVPALLHPHLSTTQGYLANRMGGIGTFNVAFFAEMGTFYNSTYFFAGLVALVIAGTILGWRRARTPALALTLWWLPFFVLYIFIVRFPGTHFYLVMQSWSLLAAVPLALLTAPSTRPALRYTTVALAGVWLLVSSHYLYLLFFRQQPEYLVNIDSERVPAYWAPFPVPEKPRFGFPIHEGWQAIGTLGAWGYLPGSETPENTGDDDDVDITYATNDRAWSLRRWYLTPFSKRDFDELPDYVFVAAHVQEADPDYAAAEDAGLLDGYVRAGDVRVRGEPRIEIWARTPLPAYLAVDAEDFAAPFLHDLAALEPWPDPPARVQDVALSESVTLQSAHLERTRYAPGDIIPLLLVWRADAPLPVDYARFVHVADADGRPIAQADGPPGFGTARTSQWPDGEPFRDHVFVRIPDDAPPGQYTLFTGLYDPATGERLAGAAAPIATVEIR